METTDEKIKIRMQHSFEPTKGYKFWKQFETVSDGNGHRLYDVLYVYAAAEKSEWDLRDLSKENVPLGTEWHWMLQVKNHKTKEDIFVARYTYDWAARKTKDDIKDMDEEFLQHTLLTVVSDGLHFYAETAKLRNNN